MDELEFAHVMKKFVNTHTGLNMGYRETYDAIVKMYGYSQAIQVFIAKMPNVPNEPKPQT